MPTPSITEVHTPQSRCCFAIAWCDITPPANIYHRMWGAAKHDRATGVHRPLRATVTIFSPLADADQKQIILALDHCTLGIIEHEHLVAKIATQTGQAKDSILVVFSHTHGAGLMGLDRVELPGGDLIPAYLQSLADKSAQLVNQCLASLAPANIVYGQGRCALAAHRDYVDETTKQIIVGFNPGEPGDDTVIVARVSNDEGAAIATIVNYACHPTTLAWDNTLISPDYIGAMRDVIESETHAPCLFLQGACGELGPREGFVGDTEVADRNGRELGYAALSALTALPAAGTKFCYTGPVVSGATLGAWEHQPTAINHDWQITRWQEPLKYRPNQPTADQIKAELHHFQSEEAAAKARGDEASAADHRAMAERKHRLLHRLEVMPKGDHYPLQIIVLHLGDAVWIAVQGESYNLLQTELRRRFQNKPIIVASLASDWGASYLPPRELYGKDIYQVNIAVVAAGSLEQLIDSIAKRLANA